jgi:tripartite-type tricarboxylate transporter receptor subunit TctC
LAEAGVPGMVVTSFGGLSVPTGTPAPVVKRIEEALTKVLANPEVRSKLEANGGVVSPSSPQEYADSLKSEIALTERLMKSARLEPQ